MRRLRYLFAAVIAFGAVACGDPLTYTNPNSPDKALALSRPVDVEALIAASFNTAHMAMHGSSAALQSQLVNAGMESYSALGNYNMGLRAAVPRSFIDNSRGSPPSENTGSAYDFQRLERAARAASLGLVSLNRTGFTIGSPARNQRARAFAHFVKGYALGHLALAYDSGAVVTEYDVAGVTPPLVAYDSLMRAAYFFLDSAIAIANGAVPAGPTSDWFPLPYSWMRNNTPASMTAANFVAFIRGIKAKFRAQVARTPAGRAAANWTLIEADAKAALGTDYVIDLKTSDGWDYAWLGTNNSYGNWASGYQFMLAFADTTHTGTRYEFDTWLATTPVYNRQPFLIQTRDKRFPAGADRTTQGNNSTKAIVTSTGYPYWTNRAPGKDAPGDALAAGYYDHFRFIGIQTTPSRAGPFPLHTRAEMNLLIAEAEIRVGTVAAALPWIDSSRVKSNLPSLVAAGITDTIARVPGGTACVPRIPAPPTYTSTICGNVWEALKWEMRMETAFTGWGQWYFNGRGWGDLPEGTPINWPVPYLEMDARGTPFYNLGGVGVPSGTAKGSYGLWSGGLY